MIGNDIGTSLGDRFESEKSHLGGSSDVLEILQRFSNLQDIRNAYVSGIDLLF